MATATEVILTTCPRDCYDSCGIAVRIRDGAIDQVRGDPDHPMSRGALCAKCSTGYNNEWLDPDVRLTRPLRRVGPKGAGQFAPDLVGRGHRRRSPTGSGGSRPSSGAQTILNAHYSGTLSLLAFFFPMRFFHRLGRHRGRPGQHLQPGRARRAGLRLRDVVRGVRSAHGPRRRLRPGLGRQPGGLGAARLRALVPPGARRQDRRRPDPHRDGQGRRPAPAAVPRQRRGARLRAAPRAPARRPGRPRRSSPATPSAGTSSSRCWTTAPRPGARRRPACPPS